MQSMDVVVSQSMTREEARQCTDECKYHADRLRHHIAEIYNRKGYLALGYDTFEIWAETELTTGYKWALKMKNAVEVEQQLGTPQGDIPTKHAEQLKKLDSPKRMQKALDTARDLAAVEGKAQPSTRHIQQAVNVVLDEQAVEQFNYPLITQYMKLGKMTPGAAREACQRIEPLSPKKKGYVIQVIARGDGIATPELIPHIAALVDREDSPLRGEVDRGYINGQPVGKASQSDWDTAIDEARRLASADRMEASNERDRIEARVITLYRAKENGDVAAAARRNLKVLLDELHKADYDMLKQLMMEN